MGEPRATASESGSSASVGEETTDATRRGSPRLLTGWFTAGWGWAAGRSSIPGCSRALSDLLHVDEWQDTAESCPGRVGQGYNPIIFSDKDRENQ